MFSASGPSREYPASSNTAARPRMSSPCPPNSVDTCGANTPGILRGPLQPDAHVLGPRDATVLFLGRDHHLAHEVGGAASEVRDDGIRGEVDCHGDSHPANEY